MNVYSIALFLHISGALGIFVALGLEWTSLWQIRSAVSLEQVRTSMVTLKSVRKLGFASMLATVITGIDMTLTGWGGAAWILVTLGSLVLLIALAQALTGPRMAAIGRALVAERGVFSRTYHNLANHPLLWISIQTRAAIALGIVFLKVFRPDLAGSLIVIGVAIVLGIASALPADNRERAQEGPAH